MGLKNIEILVCRKLEFGFDGEKSGSLSFFSLFGSRFHVRFSRALILSAKESN